MIRIEIEAESAEQLLAKVHALFPSPVVPRFASFAEVLAGAGVKPGETVKFETVGQSEPSPATEGEDSRAGNAPSGTAPPATESSLAPRRGRPRKNAHPAGLSSDAQPAVASNTGSSAAVSSPPAAEQAGTAAVATTPEPSPGATAPTYTADEVRSKLQEFLQKPGGDEGLKLASKVLAQFGLTKVKQINDAPQHWASIIAAVDAELKTLSA